MDLTGSRIERYHIKSKLGQGGMADVYLALDTKIGREVAFKIIRTEMFPPIELERILKRFRQEAKALATLDHPNIIQILDYGDHDGKPYLIMPYQSGGTLREQLHGKMPWREAFKTIIPIIEAVAYAHSEQIIHRDIKPSNILLRKDGTPIITDFGVAKILSDTPGSLTLTLGAIGTPDYVAPEQWKGSAEYASDQYSIGMMLYQMITGQLPFSADTPYEVMYKVASEPLPSASGFVPDLPPQVEQLLNRMLMKDPRQRYADLGQVKAEMEGLLWGGQGTGPIVDREQDQATRKTPNELKDRWRREPKDQETIDDLDPAPVKNERKKKPFFIKRISKKAWLGFGGVLLILTLGLLGLNWLAGSILNSVISVAFSPDGSRIVSGSDDGSMKIWDAQSGALLDTLEGHTFGVNSVAFSPDGRRIVSGSMDSTVKIWDAESGELLDTLEGHISPVYSVAFSSDGRHIVSGSSDDTVKIWDAESGALLDTLRGHTSNVYSVAFSPDGKRIVSGGFGGTVKIWDAESGELLDTQEGHPRNVYSVAFSPDGKRIVSGGFDDTVKIWDADSGALLDTLEGHTYGVISVAFSQGGDRIVSGSSDDTVKIWDARSGNLLDTLRGHTGKSYVASVAFSPDGRRIVSGSHYGTVKIWDVGSGELLDTLAPWYVILGATLLGLIP